jgi:(p)ppGpp synthase/HD superfamily hydrolase
MTELGSRYRQALVWAAELHEGHVRKTTGVPYLSHLLAVSGLVLEFGGDEDEAIAGLLHDSLEDTPLTRADLEARVGSRVAEIVARCSDTEVQPKPPWRQRKERFLARLDTCGDDAGTLRVVAADKVHNTRSMLADHRLVGDGLWDRFNAGPDEQIWYLRSVSELIRRHLGGPAAVELEAVVAQLATVVSGPDPSQGTRPQPDGM